MTIQCTPEELAALMLATQERLVVHKQLTQIINGDGSNSDTGEKKRDSG